MRVEPGADLDVPTLTSAMTLEVVGLCLFSHRFGGLYTSTPTPFLQSLDRALTLLASGSGKKDLYAYTHPHAARELRDSSERLILFVDDFVKRRRALGTEHAPKDLLQHMLTATDPETGARLSDIEVRQQTLTLFIAGHETTSGTWLSRCITWPPTPTSRTGRASRSTRFLAPTAPSHPPSSNSIGSTGCTWFSMRPSACIPRPRC